MAIFYYNTKDEVPADLATDAAEVKEDGENKGKWAVNVVPRKKIEEFRDNNTALAQKVEQAEGLLKKVVSLAGVSSVEEFDFVKFSEQFQSLNETHRKVQDGKLKASDDIDRVVTERTEVMKNKFDEQLQQKQVELNQLKIQRDEAVSAYKRTFVDRAVASVITDKELGVEGTAVDDIMARARNVFVVEEDGNIIPKKAGQTMWGEDGSSPMSMKEWIDIVLRKEAPHYFVKSNGGNANGGGNDTTSYGGMSKEEFDKLPSRQKLEIANQQAFKKAR
jgi:hypothetical protein